MGVGRKVLTCEVCEGLVPRLPHRDLGHIVWALVPPSVKPGENHASPWSLLGTCAVTRKLTSVKHLLCLARPGGRSDLGGGPGLALIPYSHIDGHLIPLASLCCIAL